MTRSEVAIVILLRVVGISGMFAIPAVFLPFSWMNSIHQFLGLGELPDTPIVSYLARSLSAFYAIVAAFTLLVSTDIRRYHRFVSLWAYTVIVLGLVLTGIDLEAGLPHLWTLCEGPPTFVVGFVVLWLHRREQPHPDAV